MGQQRAGGKPVATHGDGVVGGRGGDGQRAGGGQRRAPRQRGRRAQHHLRGAG